VAQVAQRVAPRCLEPIVARVLRGVEFLACFDQVARRAHTIEHVIFLVPCARCHEPLEHCGSCEPSRLYHPGACSIEARKQSAAKARATFAARKTPEGLALHALEQASLRERKREARVGDHSCHDVPEPVDGPGLVTNPSQETPDELPSASSSLPADAPQPTGESGCRRQPGVGADRVTWILAVDPEYLETAQQRLGTEMACPVCGRHGRVARVVPLRDWKRFIRRGLEPPAAPG